MQIITKKEDIKFNLDVVKESWCVYIKHISWEQGITGYISALSKDSMTIQFCPGIRNVSNHTFVTAESVAKGEWELRISPDLKDIFEFKEGTIES